MVVLGFTNCVWYILVSYICKYRKRNECIYAIKVYIPYRQMAMERERERERDAIPQMYFACVFLHLAKHLMVPSAAQVATIFRGTVGRLVRRPAFHGHRLPAPEAVSDLPGQVAGGRGGESRCAAGWKAMGNSNNNNKNKNKNKNKNT